MNTKYKITTFLFIAINISLTHAQITITEIENKEEKTILKPTPYDSMYNWRIHKRLFDYKEYIGVQIYFPPYSESWLNIDSSKISDMYFTIVNVTFNKNDLNPLIPNDNLGGEDYREITFILRNNKTGDTLYYMNKGISYIGNDNYRTILNEFIIVPYYIKQKQLYQNEYLIFKSPSSIKGLDVRFSNQIEDGEGNKDISYKEVTIESGSEWLCSDVTLMKSIDSPKLYSIYYILNNDKNEQIIISRIHPIYDYYNHLNFEEFILKKDYLKKENDRKQEKFIKKDKERIANEKHRLECINKFGSTNGDLIAQGKVKIGMTTEMCKEAWGIPWTIDKVTTSNGIKENWSYGYGYRLCFENGYLIMIQESK